MGLRMRRQDALMCRPPSTFTHVLQHWKEVFWKILGNMGPMHRPIEDTCQNMRNGFQVTHSRHNWYLSLKCKQGIAVKEGSREAWIKTPPGQQSASLCQSCAR